MAGSIFTVGGSSYEIFRLDSVDADVSRLPFTLRILLENVLRHGEADDVGAVAGWVSDAEPSREISFRPSRVLHQDFTGVPAIVDLAAMRHAMHELGGDPAKVSPQLPSELVIDHSVQVDVYASKIALHRNSELEFERNRERYAFLRWGRQGFDGLQVVPPATGIVHQVNLEFLARVVEARDGQAFPDTLLGTDSHTTMVNGLGVLGWGVGGIEAEAAMLGEAVSMLVPQVVGFRLLGELPEQATATDLVLTVTEMLRSTGVVGKFVEYFGEGLAALPLADRATIGNMSPEYGATCGFFPVDGQTIDYLKLTGRDEERIALVEAYCKENLLWHDPADGEPDYSEAAGLQEPLSALGFDSVGYGCTTCIGNSGPLAESISEAISDSELVVCAVLSGNRNFEARIHPEVKANYLASPPLVVAYALAGRMDLDLLTEPLGHDADGHSVYLRDIWPSPEEVQEVVTRTIRRELFRRNYDDVYTGDEQWRSLPVPEGDLYEWEEDSTYIRRPPYFDGMPREPGTVEDVTGARCLVMVGDSATTDHISPAGAIKPDSPAGRYLVEHGVEPRNFNSYGSRRGNHEVMMRGTFANMRLRNLMVPGSEGTWTVHVPSGDETTIYDAALRYEQEGIPLIVIAGREYGSGSSRDWAAKGPALLGVRAVIAESYERIHRS